MKTISLLAFLAAASLAGSAQQAPGAAQRLTRLAAAVTHFATDDIIRNRWSERRWPAGLLEEQQRVLEELRASSGARDALQALLVNADPRIRTLALGALFIREEPRDLPSIAALMDDSAETIPQLQSSMDSRGGPLPLSFFESSQTVGDVAQAMVRFYLDAAFEPRTFKEYWADHGSRAHSASWSLVKMRRATRQESPLQPQYDADIRRVLAEIDALPPVDRAWTLLYVRTGVFLSDTDTLVPDRVVVLSLQTVGSDALMKLLRGEAPTDDPDLRPDVGGDFILANAPSLLRSSDASAVLACAEIDRRNSRPTRWIAAAAKLRALDDVETAAISLKAEIQRILPGESLGPSRQAELAFALWQMRGATEREFLTQWFYSALPFVRSPHALEYFLRDVEREARADTPALLAAIVGDARFERTDWPVLARILEMVNKTRASPLVETRSIYDHLPASNRPDQKETLAAWRRMLREHFGGKTGEINATGEHAPRSIR